MDRVVRMRSLQTRARRIGGDVQALCEVRASATRLDRGQSGASASAYAHDFEPADGELMIMQELLTSDAGLMSLGVIVFMLGMGVFMYFRFRAFVREDSARKR